MQFSEEVKVTLWNLIDEMSVDLSQFTVNPDKDFTRKKKWDFQTVIKFIISMESQSLKNELHKYFGYTTDCPTNASFIQRRAKIKSDAFKHLFKEFTAAYNNRPSLFNGYRILACDGSDINIAHNPKDEETYFTHGDAKGFNQLHLNAMYDLLDKIYTDIIIQPARNENEHKAFCDMVDRYNGEEKTIFIVDRGYESYNNLAHVMEKNVFFLFRCKDINSSGILSGSKHKLPDEEHAYYDMTLRVLRFPISETVYECVITNLPADDFSAEEIKKLYAMRWGIETSFRELKYAVGLTSFHAKKREYITQEIWARLILYNFCEIITAHVSIQKCTTKHTYQINYTFAIHICRYFISKMAEKSPPDVEALIGKEIFPVRPGRHDPRKVDHKKAVSFLYRVA